MKNRRILCMTALMLAMLLAMGGCKQAEAKETSTQPVEQVEETEETTEEPTIGESTEEELKAEAEAKAKAEAEAEAKAKAEAEAAAKAEAEKKAAEEAAKAEAEKSGATFKEDAGRGWRKVVASPKPVDIKEINTIRTLLNDGQVVVAAGGGGIPVVKEADGSLSGVEAVIDKDFASQRLAELVEADLFIVLTGVDYVFVNYNKPDQAKLEHVNVAQLEEYIKQDQFAPGSMLPKVEAAIAFVNGRPEGKAVITSLENLGALIESESGTIIQKD